MSGPPNQVTSLEDAMVRSSILDASGGARVGFCFRRHLCVSSNGVIIAFLLAAYAADCAATNIPSQFSTNAPGEYLLKRAWSGESVAVIHSGDLATWTNSPEPERLARELRFDFFIVRDKSSADPPGLIIAHRPGLLVIAESRGQATNGSYYYTMPHVFRSTLPSNTEIKACSTVPKLTELLGAPHEADGPPHVAFWRYFTFTSTSTIETLSVVCAGEWKGAVNGLVIRRGAVKESD